MSTEKKGKREKLPHMHIKDKDKFADVIADRAIAEINAHRKSKGLPPIPKG